MKPFIKKVLYFLIPILALAYPLDSALSCILKKTIKGPYEHQVWNYIYESKEVPDIAIYGSSKAWVQVSPEMLEKTLKKSVYNYGYDGQTFLLEYMRHLEICKHKKKSKNIILLLDIGSLTPNKGLYNHVQYLPYMLHNKNMEKYVLPFDYYDVLDFQIPLKRYASQGMVFIYWFWKDSNVRIKGYAPNDKRWNDDLKNAKKHQNSMTTVIDSSYLALLEQFIIESKSNKTHLIFLTTPDYIEGQEFMINCKEIIALYQNLSKKHQIPYLNYYNDSMIYDQSLYYNASHLNKKGAEILSKKLASDLKKYF
jgi:hypothetical protein